MPTPRRLQVSLEATPYYHCISRCVRRAYLCGEDRLTQKSFDHRKGWLLERMKELTSIFAIDICAYAVLSNHFHIVARIDRERALGWRAEEVVARYGRLFRGSVRGWAELPESERSRRIELWRQRLWSLSWLMRCLNESIARRANREDGCTGRFWEGRFRSQALLDEGAVLTCMSYVDLNPIRAGIATTLEDSEFTSIRERLQEAAAERAQGTVEAAFGWTEGSLLPFAGEQGAAQQPREQRVEPLPMELGAYVALLESTGRAIREQRSGGDELPRELGPVLEGVGLDPGGFVASVREFGRSFFGMVGEVHRIEVESRRRGYARCMGRQAARRLYHRAAAA